MGMSFKDLVERVIELVDYYGSCVSASDETREKAAKLTVKFLDELEELFK